MTKTVFRTMLTSDGQAQPSNKQRYFTMTEICEKIPSKIQVFPYCP